MDYYCCPACGSHFFLSSKSTSRTVFKVRLRQKVEIQESPGNEQIALQRICCGACSWKGGVDDLVIAR